MEQHEKQAYFKGIYEREIDSIFRFVFLRVSKREDALDITGEVFLKFWEVVNKGQIIDFERALLFTIARNKIIDWYRKTKPESLEIMMSEESGGEGELQIVDHYACEEILVTSEAKLVIKTMNKLPTQYREIIDMRFIQDLSLFEMAKILNVTENAISIRLNRAITKLKEIMHT